LIKRIFFTHKFWNFLNIEPSIFFISWIMGGMPNFSSLASMDEEELNNGRTHLGCHSILARSLYKISKLPPSLCFWRDNLVQYILHRWLTQGNHHLSKNHCRLLVPWLGMPCWFLLQSGVEKLLACGWGYEPATLDVSTQSGSYDLPAMATPMINHLGYRP